MAWEPRPEREGGQDQQRQRRQQGRPATHRVHDREDTTRSSGGGRVPMHTPMEGCLHGMEPAWCFLCRIERSGADPRTAWSLNAWDDERDPGRSSRPDESQPGELPQIPM